MASSATPAMGDMGTTARPLSVLAWLDRGRHLCIPGEKRVNGAQGARFAQN